MKLNPLSLTVLLALGVSTNALADQCDKLPSAQLTASSQEEISNDMVRLNWQIQVQTPQAAEAMGAVNKALETSIANLSKNPEVSKIRNNIQTFPQYTNKDRTISTWQAIGTLSFEMKVQALKTQGALKVADGLTLSNLEYFPSQATLEASRAKLLQEAMKEFQAKAQLVAQGFSRSGYTLAELSINDEQGGRPVPMVGRMYAASADMMAKSGMEVSAAAGSSQNSVSVSGRVCLKP